jgi:hypothetical protein
VTVWPLFDARSPASPTTPEPTSVTNGASTKEARNDPLDEAHRTGLGGGRAARTLALLGAIGHGALAGVYLLWASVPGDGASRVQLIHLISRSRIRSPTGSPPRRRSAA